MHVGSSNQPHAPGRHCAGRCFKLADFRGETKEEKKSTTERITEGCLKVLMENKIDRLKEKNHNVFHHKSSVKLVTGLRGKGRLLVGSLSPWAPVLPLGPSFSFRRVLLPCSPSCAPPSTLAEVLASTGVTSSREPATHTTSPSSVFPALTGSLGPRYPVDTDSGGQAHLPHLYPDILHTDSDTEQSKIKAARNMLKCLKKHQCITAA